MSATVIPRHQITRVRRETRRRGLTVAAVERLTPGMRRIHFTAPELHDFESAAPDDHVKLFLPVAGEVVMRDYTPRCFDAAAGRLTIDFALHGDGFDGEGPATAWARGAGPGDTLAIGGPRGSQIVADDFDWYLLIGDETALPAIGRRVEELRAGVPVTSLVLVGSAAERQHVATRAAWTPLWISRDGAHADADLLGRALAGLRLPDGEGFVWIAAEADAARSLRAAIAARGHPREWMKASGYWVRGNPGTHTTLAE